MMSVFLSQVWERNFTDRISVVHIYSITKEFSFHNVFWGFSSDSKAGDIVYKAQSQDEEALVIAAAKLNMVFVGKNANLLGNDDLISVWLSLEYVSKK